MEKHISVLLKESIDALNIKEESQIVDCTLGYAGHSSEILKRVKKGFLFAFDQDLNAIEYSNTRLSSIASNYKIIKSNFKNLKIKLNEEDITEVDGFLFDLGVSSPQLDDAERGFSFHQDARLDMRMDQEQNLSAYEVINEYSDIDLTKIFFQYGEEKYSKSIARNIVKQRQNKNIETTFELVEIIKRSMPEKAKRDHHPARKTFQAIRIEVNKELEILEDSLKDAISMLKVNGRVVVITFHSLEDKIVKRLFKKLTEVDPFYKGMPNVSPDKLPNYKLGYNKSIEPTQEELEINKRARSSRLRVIERIK